MLPATCVRGRSNAHALISLIVVLLLASRVVSAFIRVNGTLFVDSDCGKTFTPTGWNGWEMLETEIENPSLIDAAFSQTKADGFNTVRIFAFGTSRPLQTSPVRETIFSPPPAWTAQNPSPSHIPPPPTPSPLPPPTPSPPRVSTTRKCSRPSTA